MEAGEIGDLGLEDLDLQIQELVELEWEMEVEAIQVIYHQADTAGRQQRQTL